MRAGSSRTNGSRSGRDRPAAFLALLLVSAVMACSTMEDASAAERRGGARTPVSKNTAGALKRARKPPRWSPPRAAPSHPVQFTSFAEPAQASVGGRVVLTVRLAGAAGPAEKAALHVVADPALMKYVGVRPTGRGALIVEPSKVHGELVVYRSSLPEGFAPSEDLVELEYETLAPGICSFVLTQGRLFDAGARELKTTYESTSLVIH